MLVKEATGNNESKAIIFCCADILFQLGNIQVTHNINSFWPGDAIFHWSGSTLAEVMACCLTAPGHYLNKCWFTIKGVLWHSPESNFTRSAHKLCLKITLLKLLPHLPGPSELTLSNILLLQVDSNLNGTHSARCSTTTREKIRPHHGLVWSSSVCVWGRHWADTSKRTSQVNYI